MTAPASPPPAPPATKLPRRSAPPWLCVTVNQLAFPGLGTIMAQRKIGYLQAAVMIAGFVLTMGFLLTYLSAVAQYLQHSEWSEEQFRAQYLPHQWAIVAGTSLCGLAWIWALVSSWQIWKASQSPGPGNS